MERQPVTKEDGQKILKTIKEARELLRVNVLETDNGMQLFMVSMPTEVGSHMLACPMEEFEKIVKEVLATTTQTYEEMRKRKLENNTNPNLN